MKYIVWCTVSGGVTGRREGPLKMDGKIVKVDTWEEAEQICQQARGLVNGPHATARFTYVPRLETVIH